MVQESFNTGERSTISRKKGTALSYQQMKGREEPDETPMDVGPGTYQHLHIIADNGAPRGFFPVSEPPVVRGHESPGTPLTRIIFFPVPDHEIAGKER